jgi:hypothetical protein
MPRDVTGAEAPLLHRIKLLGEEGFRGSLGPRWGGCGAVVRQSLIINARDRLTRSAQDPVRILVTGLLVSRAYRSNSKCWRLLLVYHKRTIAMVYGGSPSIYCRRSGHINWTGVVGCIEVQAVIAGDGVVRRE